MASEMANNNENRTLARLINKFEKAIALEQTVYFDIDEIVEIFDYYVDKKNIGMLRKAIDYGLKLYEDTYKILILEAKYQISESNFAAAEKALKKAEKDEPHNGEVDIIRAMILIFQKNYEKAATSVKIGIKKGGRDLDYMFLPLGMSYLQQKKYLEGATFLKKYLEYYPESKEILAEIGYAYFQDKRYVQAMKYYKEHLDNFPYNENSWIQLAKTYTILGLYTEADHACDFAININPQSAKAYFEKGVIYLEEKKLFPAYIAFMSAIKHGMENAEIHVNIGKFHLYQNNFIEAVDEFDKALKFSDARHAEIHYLLSLVYENSNNSMLNALNEIQKALEYQHDNVTFLQQKALILNKLHRFEESEQIFKDILKRNYLNETGWLNFAELYHVQNKTNVALEVLSSAVLHIEDSYLIYSKLTAYSLILNRLQEAKEYFDKAYKLNRKAIHAIVQFYPASLKIEFIDNLYKQRDAI